MTDNQPTNSTFRGPCLSKTHFIVQSVGVEVESVDQQTVLALTPRGKLAQEFIEEGVAVFAVLDQQVGVTVCTQLT